jgi:hypothetical protein
MLCFLSRLNQPACKRGWQLGVHDEAHQAKWSTGWSLWRAANSSAAVMSPASSRG